MSSMDLSTKIVIGIGIFGFLLHAAFWIRLLVRDTKRTHRKAKVVKREPMELDQNEWNHYQQYGEQK